MAKQKKFVQNNNNLAIAYYRYSSHAQNEASIAQQREAAEKYAEAHGFTIMKEYADEALPGTSDDRPKFQLMLTEVGEELVYLISAIVKSRPSGLFSSRSVNTGSPFSSARRRVVSSPLRSPTCSSVHRAQICALLSFPRPAPCF